MALGVVAGQGVTLSAEQEAAVARVMELSQECRRDGKGRVVYISGNAGAGKSTVLNTIRKRAEVIVTAPTGLAALNVGGATVHRFFGIRGNQIIKSKCRPLFDRREAIQRADMIAIDEISMVRADLLDGINWTLQKTFATDEPFAGKLIVGIGDMLQLEPVVREQDEEWLNARYKSRFWFDANVLRGRNTLPREKLVEEPDALVPERFELTQIFRQTGHDDFVQALNQLRIGDPAGLEFINRRRQAVPGDRELPVVVTFTRGCAERINTRRLEALDCEAHTYVAEIEGEFAEDEYPTSKELSLKAFAQVMVCKNIEDQDGELIANGSVGLVVGFASGWPVVELTDGRIVVIEQDTWEAGDYATDMATGSLVRSVAGTFTQVPLKLAWAATVHKMQGQTLESMILELEMDAFAHGQIYVGISRVKDPSGLYLRRRITEGDLKIHPRIREWCGIPELTRVGDLSAFGGAK